MDESNLARAEAGYLRNLHDTYEALIGCSDREAADAYDAAVATLEQDTDTYGDWLASQMGAPVKFGIIPRDDVRFADWFETLTVGELVMFASIYGSAMPARAGRAMRRVWGIYAEQQGVPL